MILITGAGGFVGRLLCERLGAAAEVLALVRSCDAQQIVIESSSRLRYMETGDLNSVTNWPAILRGVETVIHLAARTHVLRETEPDPLAAYRRINVGVTNRLAHACAEAGVKRLVFLSSVKVSGEITFERPFRESDAPRPQDAYGVSKLEAEVALAEIRQVSGLEIVILRPPLVYGPGVKGNFLRLLGAAQRNWPLPLAAVQNRRSFIFVENLVDALIVCATHANAASKTYLVSDGADLSTPELLRQLSSRLGAHCRLWRCPPWLVQGVANMIGRGAEASRLLGSLQVDSSLIHADLGWNPPFTVAEGLDRTTQWYRKKFL